MIDRSAAVDMLLRAAAQGLDTGAPRPFERLRLSRLAEHLPGKHDQSTHGAHGGSGQVIRGVREHGGGTYEAAGNIRSIHHGAVVARKGGSMAVDAARFDADPEYRAAAISAYRRDHHAEFAQGGKMGVWDSRTEGGHDIVFDVVDVVSRTEAIKLGKERGEDGVYDLDGNGGKGEYVPTGGKTYT